MDAVILAAGEGTRLMPLTITRPKPMLTIAGKPILQWNLESLPRDFRKAVLVVGYKKEKVIDHFGSEFNGLQIDYVEQKEHLGTAHAISVVEDHVKGDFLVINGDLLVSREFINDLLSNHKPNSESLSLVEVEDASQFGIVELKGDKVQGIKEKPKKPKSNMANAGVYIFNEKIFDAIKQIEKSKRLEYEITDAIDILIREGRVHGFKCRGHWMDIGRPWDLLDGNEALLKDMDPGICEGAEVEPYTTIKGNVHIGKGTVIRSGAYIEGPCYIGENCIIGPNCFLRQHTSLGDNVHVGNAVEIKNSIIMSNTNVGHLSYVGDSIIGEGCNFGAGTKIANLRFDEGDVKVSVKGRFESSGRKKFGAVFGDGVKTGINASIMPGISIYPGAWVEPGIVVRDPILRGG
ncbi:MAG: hypothetical protein A7316_07735 [Candidatus Altiarchaeales archaeon WOR_SM1_86-2]|nr:MAG: hypothetical protein A7316_07735 [Candidatus Altiarchaeales archaeon WOR_SM1_86-2]